MIPHDPASAVPPRLSRDRDPGDAWVEGPGGERYWGRFGAAGVLVHHSQRGVLLQHRALWSHHGGTWGLPGGALHQGESPLEGALREAREEASVPPDAVEPIATLVADRQVWLYTTLVARASRDFAPAPADAESLELRWVLPEGVASLPLHPAFGAAWPTLATIMQIRLRLIVDMANVVGSRPDGWWKDRQGATARLAARLAHLRSRGIPAADLGLPGATWFPTVEAVVEGAARGAAVPIGIEVVEAPAEGDTTIRVRATDAVRAGDRVIVVTSDRELETHVRAAGAATWSSGRLLSLLDGLES